MRKKKKDVVFYASGSVEVLVPLTVHVDENDEDWFTPAQIDLLEDLNSWAAYGGHNLVTLASSITFSSACHTGLTYKLPSPSRDLIKSSRGPLGVAI